MTEAKIEKTRVDASMLIARIGVAMRTLESRKSAIAQLHNERIKRLKQGRERLSDAFNSPETVKGPVYTLLEPDTLLWVDNPEEGL